MRPVSSPNIGLSWYSNRPFPVAHHGTYVDLLSVSIDIRLGPIQTSALRIPFRL